MSSMFLKKSAALFLGSLTFNCKVLKENENKKHLDNTNRSMLFSSSSIGQYDYGLESLSQVSNLDYPSSNDLISVNQLTKTFMSKGLWRIDMFHSLKNEDRKHTNRQEDTRSKKALNSTACLVPQYNYLYVKA